MGGFVYLGGPETEEEESKDETIKIELASFEPGIKKYLIVQHF